MIPLNRNLTPLKRSAIRVYSNLARETEDCAMLTIGEPDFDTPEAIKLAAMAALQDNRTHYAPNQGTLSLRISGRFVFIIIPGDSFIIIIRIIPHRILHGCVPV